MENSQQPAQSSLLASRYFWGVILLTVLGIGLRLPYITRTIRYDEAWGFLEFIRQPFPNFLTDYHSTNNHIFFHLLAHIARALLGDAPWVFRLPALFFGIALIPTTYWVGRKFFGQAALMAAGLVAVSTPLVSFSVNARGYTIYAFIFLVMLGLAKRLKERSNRTEWLIFGTLAAVGFYTTPQTLYPMGVVSLWLLLSIIVEKSGTERRNLLIHFSGGLGALLTSVLYSPILLGSGMANLGQIRSDFHVSGYDLLHHLASIPYLVVGYADRTFPQVIAWGLLGGFFASLIFHEKITSDRIPLVIPILLWILPVIFVQSISYFTRIWIFLVPVYYLLAAAGLYHLLHSIFNVPPQLIMRGSMLVVALLGINLVRSQIIITIGETGRVDNPGAIGKYMADNITPQDEVIWSVKGSPAQYQVEYWAYRYGYEDLDLIPALWAGWTAERALEAVQGRILALIPNSVEGREPDSLENLAFMLGVELDPQLLTYEHVQSFEHGHLFELRPALQGVSTLPYEDNFDDGLGAAWESSEGVQAQDDGTLLIGSDTDWEYICLKADAGWQDYAVDVDLRLVQITPDGEDIFLNVRMNLDAGSNYAASVDADTSTGNLSGDTDGVWRGFFTDPAALPLEVTIGHWIHLRLEVAGPRINFHMEGHEVLSYTDSHIVADGTVRILVPAGVQVEVDNLTVTALEPDTVD